jgi:hypothetical protein
MNMFSISQLKNQDQKTAHSRRDKAKRRSVTLTRWLLLALFLLTVLAFIVSRTWRSLPKIAVTEISELTGCKVETKSINFKFDGSALIEGLVIRPHQKQKYDNALIKAKTVFARFSIGSLLLLRPRLKEIYINDFTFNAQYNSDTNRWNLAALKLEVQKSKAGKMPLISLSGGTLQYGKVSNGQATVLAAVPIDMRFRPAEGMLGGYRFDIITAKKANSDSSTNKISERRDRSRLAGLWLPGRVTVTGGISSAGIPAFENAWVIEALDAALNYDRRNNFLLKLKIRDSSYLKESSSETLSLGKPESAFGRSVLFTALQNFFTRYNPVGKVDMDIEVSGNFSQLSKSTVTGKVCCKDVTVCDVRFPYTIEQVTGQIDFTENSVILNELCGRHGDVEVTMAGWVKDFGPDQRYQIKIASNNMALDNDLYEALNPKQKIFWSAFSPNGLATIDYSVSRSALGEQMVKQKALDVELRDAEAVYRRFPYPLKSLTGKLYFDNDSITVSDVVSKANGGKITFNGAVNQYNADQPFYNLSIKASNVPFDPTLARTLLAEQGALYNQFDMTGLADADIKIFTATEDMGQESSQVGRSSQRNPAELGQEALSYSSSKSRWTSFFADVNLKQASLKANKSGLVISDISAKVHLKPYSTSIKNFTGRYGQSLVSLVGGIWLADTDKAQSPRYYLALGAQQAQLSDELIGMLPASLAKTVLELEPEGRVNISANLRKANSSQQNGWPDYNISVECLGNSINFKRFLYPLKNITGRLTMTNNKVTFEDFTALPADSTQEIHPPLTDSTPFDKLRTGIKLNGQIALVDNAFSEGSFQLSAKDISLGEHLTCALPASAVAFYQVLSPTGRFDLNLENVKITKADNGEKQIDFAATLAFTACNFNMSGTRAELDAVLKTEGLYLTGSGLSDGHVSVIADNLKIKGKSMTGLKADVIYDPHLRNWLSKNLTADCYDGRLTGKLEISPAGGTLEYLLQVAFDDVDLKQFLLGEEAADAATTSYTSGTMSGSLNIGAQIGDNSSRLGRCRLAIKNMQVGKLSPLAKLLYVVKLTEPKDFAFERMIVDSYIRSDNLLFDVFDLSGETVAFHGSGSMSLKNANIDLNLTARGRRLVGNEPTFLGSLTESLGRAVVRIEVTGNVHDPKVEIKTLPVVKDSLKILGTPR